MNISLELILSKLNMNKNQKVINDFGNEWKEFDFSEINRDDLIKSFDQYFHIFPFNQISINSIGFDMGCGSGRWAQFIAPRVQKLNCIEPSEAINVAKKNLKKFNNISYFQETTDSCTLENNSQDFGYCLGVLHHIPDTEMAIRDCANLLKKDSPFLLYLYYNFENKPFWFRFLWKVTDLVRKLISKLPNRQKKIACNFIAYSIYYPLSRLAYLIEKIGINVSNFPLSDYRSKPFYICKNDSLDRFGTRLEQRFSKSQIKKMLINSGFKDIKFSDKTPFWCCISKKT